MVYSVRTHGVTIGHSDLEDDDRAMGVAIGVFRPGPSYELVQPIFLLKTDIVGLTSAHPVDEAKLARYRQAFATLALELVDEHDDVVQTTWIEIDDCSREGGPDAFEMSAEIPDETFWAKR